jgi:hypothetical protein
LEELRWLQALMRLMFGGTGVRWKVTAGGWERDASIGVELWCDGWGKRFRVALSTVRNEDFRAIATQLATQSDGGIVLTEMSIQALESERLPRERMH